MFWRNKPFLKHCFYSNKLSKAEKFPRRGVPKFSRKHFTTVSETKTVINYRVTYLYVIVKYAHNNLNTSIHLENAYFLINRLIDIKHIIWNLSIYNLPRRALIYHGLYKYTGFYRIAQYVGWSQLSGYIQIKAAQIDFPSDLHTITLRPQWIKIILFI